MNAIWRNKWWNTCTCRAVLTVFVNIDKTQKGENGESEVVQGCFVDFFFS